MAYKIPPSGNFVMIAEQNVSGVSECIFNDSAIATFDTLFLVYQETMVSVDNTKIWMQLSTDGGGTWVSTGYQAGTNQFVYNANAWFNTNSTQGFVLNDSIASVGRGACGTAYFFNMNNGSDVMMQGTCTYDQGTSLAGLSGGFSSTTNANAIRIFPTAGVFQGKFTLYGLLTNSTLNPVVQYIAGTFVPTFYGNTNGGTTTYNRQIGKFIRIGNQVNVWGSMDIASCTDTGNVQFGGLPFISKNNGLVRIVGYVEFNGPGYSFPAGYTQIGLEMFESSTVAYPVIFGLGVSSTAFDVVNSGTVVLYNFTYEAV